MRQLGQADRKTLQPFGKIMGGRLAFQRGVHGKHNLVNAASRNTGDKRVDIQIFRSHAIQCRETPAKDMIFSGEQPRPIQRPKIGHILHNTNCAYIAARVGADTTGVDCIDITAGATGFKPFLNAFQRAQQRLQNCLALFHEMQHHAPRGTRPQPRKPRQSLCERVYFLRCHEGVASAPFQQRKAPQFGGIVRLIFMGTPDFAVPTLNALVAAGHDICAVYTQPPRPANRGKKLTPSAVQARAEALGLEVRTPTSLKGAEEQAAFTALEADIAVVAAYGLILPQAILDAPKHGCLNVHGSLLPRWRGAAPVQRAILAGDEETGVCIMQMESGLDTGPVRAMLSTPISKLPTDTAGNLAQELANIGAHLMVKVLADLDGHPAVPQTTEGVTYAAKIDKAEAKIDFAKAAEFIERQVRAFNPTPGAFFEHQGERFKVLEADDEDQMGEPGLVLDDQLLIACGIGAIRPTIIQRAGKPAMPVADFLRGKAIPAGTRLS